jgi:hypothetical protein
MVTIPLFDENKGRCTLFDTKIENQENQVFDIFSYLWYIK